MNPLENANNYIAELQQNLMKKAQLYRQIATIMEVAYVKIEQAVEAFTTDKPAPAPAASYANTYEAPTKEKKTKPKGMGTLTIYVHKAMKKYDKEGSSFTLEELAKRASGFVKAEGFDNEIHLKTAQYGLNTYLKKYHKVTTHIIESGVYYYSITDDTRK